MPVWEKGKHLATLTVAGGTRNDTTGVITYATATSIASSVDFIRWGAANRSAEIFPVNATGVHNEPTLVDSSFSVGEIKKYALDILPALAIAYTYIKVAWTTTGGKSYTYEGMCGALSDGITSEGKNTTELSVMQTQPGGLVVVS